MMLGAFMGGRGVSGGGGPSTLSEAILSLGPMMYWRFNETSGTTLEDYSGNDNSLNYTGAPSFSQPSLDASSSDTSTDLAGVSYLQVPYAFAGSSAFTFELLLGAVSGTANQRIFDLQSGNHYILWVNFPSAGQLSLYSNATYITANVDFSIPHHIVAVYQSGVTEGHVLYVDGIEEASMTTSFGNGGSVRTIGRRRDQPTEHLNAALDEFAIYDAVLTPAQVQEHATLAGYYP